MKKKTNVDDARNKIKQMFKGELIKELKNLYISNDRSGIKAFGKYRIRKDQSTNLYTVSSSDWEESYEFITARNAMAYCVFSHNCNTERASEVWSLDGKMASINLDIAIHTRGYKSKNKGLVGAAKYLLLYICAVLLNSLIIFIFSGILGFAHEIVAGISLIAISCILFLIQKFYFFKK